MRRGSSRSMQSPEARDLARALRISVWYARHASRGIPGNEQAARACFRYLEKSYRYWGLRGRSCSLVASPGGVVPCSCASFCGTVLFDYARGGIYTHYAALDKETCRQACTTSDRRRTPAIGIRGAPSASPASASYSSIWGRSMGFNRTRRRGASARRGWGRAPDAENLAPL